MIRQIAPLLFKTNIPATLACYKDKLGFECAGTWLDPPVYAIAVRNQQPIHFRCAEPPTANPDKYEDGCWTHTSWSKMSTRSMRSTQPRGGEFTRKLSVTPWRAREFVVRDCDGRLLVFGASL